MDEVRRRQLSDKGGTDICEENDGLWESWTNEIEGSGEDYYIEDVIDTAWRKKEFSCDGLTTYMYLPFFPFFFWG